MIAGVLQKKINPILALNPLCWYDCKRGIVKNSSNQVTKWRDRAWGQHDMIQTAGTTCPTEPTEGAGVVFTSASSQFMYCLNRREQVINCTVTGITIIAAISVSNSLSTSYVIAKRGSDYGNLWSCGVTNNSTYSMAGVFLATSKVYDNAVSGSNKTVLGFVGKSTINFYSNNELKTTSNISGSAPANMIDMLLGARRLNLNTESIYYFGGTIYDVVVFPYNLDATQFKIASDILIKKNNIG